MTKDIKKDAKRTRNKAKLKDDSDKKSRPKIIQFKDIKSKNNMDDDYFGINELNNSNLDDIVDAANKIKVLGGMIKMAVSQKTLELSILNLEVEVMKLKNKVRDLNSENMAFMDITFGLSKLVSKLAFKDNNSDEKRQKLISEIKPLLERIYRVKHGRWLERYCDRKVDVELAIKNSHKEIAKENNGVASKILEKQLSSCEWDIRSIDREISEVNELLGIEPNLINNDILNELEKYKSMLKPKLKLLQDELENMKENSQHEKILKAK